MHMHTLASGGRCVPCESLSGARPPPAWRSRGPGVSRAHGGPPAKVAGGFGPARPGACSPGCASARGLGCRAAALPIGALLRPFGPWPFGAVFYRGPGRGAARSGPSVRHG